MALDGHLKVQFATFSTGFRYVSIPVEHYDNKPAVYWTRGRLWNTVLASILTIWQLYLPAHFTTLITNACGSFTWTCDMHTVSWSTLLTVAVYHTPSTR